VPKGPRGERRPADVIGAAVKTMRILTGEETEELAPPKTKEPYRRGGKIGGAARAKSLTKEERERIARIGANARWKKS